MPNNNEIFAYNAGPPIVWGWGTGGYPGWYNNNAFYYNPAMMMGMGMGAGYGTDEQQTRAHWKYSEDRNDHISSGIEDRIKRIELKRKLKYALEQDKVRPEPRAMAEAPAIFGQISPADMVEKFFEKNLRSYEDPMTKEVIHPKLVTSVLNAKGSKNEERLRQQNGEVFRVIKNYEDGYLALIKNGASKNEAAIEVMDHLEQNKKRDGKGLLLAANGRDEPDKTELKGSLSELMRYNEHYASHGSSYSQNLPSYQYQPDTSKLASLDSDSYRNYKPDNNRNYNPSSVTTSEDTRQVAINRANEAIDRNIKLIEDTQKNRDHVGYRSQGVNGELVADWMKQLKRDMADGTLHNRTDYNTPHDRQFGGKREQYAPPVNDIVLRANPEVESKYRNLEAVLRSGGVTYGDNGTKVTTEIANDITFLANKLTSLVPGVDMHGGIDAKAPRIPGKNEQTSFVPRTPTTRR